VTRARPAVGSSRRIEIRGATAAVYQVRITR
jgi:hypothetical protein